LFCSYYGAFVVETNFQLQYGELLGRTDPSPDIRINGAVLDINDLTYRWLLPLEEVFSTGLSEIKDDMATSVPKIEYRARPAQGGQISGAKKSIRPRVLLPVFPGTVNEYDMDRHFTEAGGETDTFVFRGRTPQDVAESLEIFAKKISESQILAFSGGFADCVYRIPRITEAVRELLFRRNGLILGIGGGFGSLARLGLLPYGDITEPDKISAGCLTLGPNRIGRHQSLMTYTRAASVASPWFNAVTVGDIHAFPVSGGELRVAMSEGLLEILIRGGQIATQYCDSNGEPAMHPYYNPGPSVCAVEGIFSPDGRIFGKTGHNERMGAEYYEECAGQ
jgi:phosphoribosylformylglycinamidine synthase